MILSMANQPSPDRPPQRSLRGIPTPLWDAFDTTADSDRSAALRTYMEHATGAEPSEPLRVTPPPTTPLPIGPLVDIPIPDTDTTPAGAAMLRGLHIHVTGLLPPPSWTAADILNSLEQLGQSRVPDGYYLGAAVESAIEGITYGVYPDPD